jgi:thiol-disulfide isomerase/thioredoxin
LAARVIIKKTGGVMKNSFSVFVVVCTALFLFFPHEAKAQISPEAIKAFQDAKVPLLRQQVDSRNFTLSLLDGVNTSLFANKGKVVILNFWATWCPPCREEMPSMEILYKRFKNNGLEILAVDGGEDDDTVRQFIRNSNYTFPVLIDKNGMVNYVYGIQAIPTSFIIDREGKILIRIIGSIKWDSPEIIKAFDALLKSR